LAGCGRRCGGCAASTVFLGERNDSLPADDTRYEHGDLAIGRIKIRSRVIVDRPNLECRAVGVAAIAADDLREAQVITLDGAMDGRFVNPIIHGYANDDKVAAGVEVVEPRKLHFAARTPGCPEIHQHPLAPVIGQANGIALGVGEGEAGSLGSMTRAGDQDAKCEAEDAEPLFQSLSFSTGWSDRAERNKPLYEGQDSLNKIV